MVVKTINDWRYLFSKHAIGGRFVSFTFFHVSFMKTGEPLIDGFTVIILGLGVRIAR
jgi:hypothetical protein